VILDPPQHIVDLCAEGDVAFVTVGGHRGVRRADPEQLRSVGDDNDILVIDSQSILGAYSEEGLPPDADGAIEADLAFFDDPDVRTSDLVDGAIGEGPSTSARG